MELRLPLAVTRTRDVAIPRAPLRLMASLAAILAGGCGRGDTTLLEVRTTFPAGLREALEESFEAARPDVDLRLVAEEPDETLRALRTVEAPRFDVWLGAPAVTLERAASEGHLHPFAPVWAGGSTAPWHGVVSTPLVIAFDRSVVSLSDAPLDWSDLLHHGWYDEVGALDPQRSVEGRYFVGSMIVEALRDDDDLNRGFDWLSRLHDQVAVYEVDARALLARLESEELLLAIVSRADVEEARAEGHASLHYRVPARGTPAVIRGVALPAGSEAREAAEAFIDHLGTTEVALAIARHTFWEPTSGAAASLSLPDALVDRWTSYAPATDTLSHELDGWLERWELEVRSR